MPKETPMPDNLQEETSAFADACEETNLNENRSEKTPKMSTNLSENVVAIRSTNDLALYESEEIDKHNTPEDLIADTKEFEQIQQSLVSMAMLDHNYLNFITKEVKKRTYKMAVKNFGRTIVQHHAHKKQMLDKHYQMLKHEFSLMDQYCEDYDRNQLVPKLEFYKEKEEDAKRAATLLAEQAAKVLEDCDDWIDICKILTLSKEQVDWCKDTLMVQIEQGLKAMKLDANNN